MSALKSNQQITNFLKRSPQSDSVDDTNPPPAKRSRLGDPAVTLTAAELRAASKDDLVAHIIVLQKEIKKPAEEAPAPKSMTPEQITAKVDNARKMMISGIKSQMKVYPCRRRELSIVETLLQKRWCEVYLQRLRT